MSLETALFSILLISGVLEGFVEGQQTSDENEQGVSVSYGTFLKPRREEPQTATDDGEKIMARFAPLPALGTPENVSPRFQVPQRSPLNVPQQLGRLRPKPLTPGRPNYHFDDYRQPNYQLDNYRQPNYQLENYRQPYRQPSHPHHYLNDYNQYY